MTGSMPRPSAIGITIATAAPCEFTSLEVKNKTRPYVHGCWVTTEPRNVFRTPMWLAK